MHARQRRADAEDSATAFNDVPLCATTMGATYSRIIGTITDLVPLNRDIAFAISNAYDKTANEDLGRRGVVWHPTADVERPVKTQSSREPGLA